MALPPLTNTVRAERLRRGWSQADVAARTGLSRAAVSAIETSRVSPSAAAALAIARLFDCSFEALFRFAPARDDHPAWAWPTGDAPIASYTATIGGRVLRFPVESTATGMHAPDLSTAHAADNPNQTIILAGCDPAAGILGDHLAGAGLRLLPFTRSSGQALSLLADDCVHTAGIHLEDNARAVRDRLGDGYALLHLARWDQGLALARGLNLNTVEAAINADLRWVGRDAGSGARHCLDRILLGRPRPQGYDHCARDHHGVVQTITTGWAQAGVCVRLSAEQAGLEFISIQPESYDLIFSHEFLESPRGHALLAAVRSPDFRQQLAAATGYDTARTGELNPLAGPGAVRKPEVSR